MARLNYVLYGMVQFPKRWFDIIYMGPQAYGMYPSDYDPYIFMEDIFVCVIYVDDCILFSKEGKYIDTLVEKNCDQKFDPEHEVQIITDCLGLNFAKTCKGNDKTIKFTMDHHIDRIV